MFIQVYPGSTARMLETWPYSLLIKPSGATSTNGRLRYDESLRPVFYQSPIATSASRMVESHIKNLAALGPPDFCVARYPNHSDTVQCADFAERLANLCNNCRRPPGIPASCPLLVNPSVVWLRTWSAAACGQKHPRYPDCHALYGSVRRGDP